MLLVSPLRSRHILGQKHAMLYKFLNLYCQFVRVLGGEGDARYWVLHGCNRVWRFAR
jgi:hypothetical protein